MKKVLLVDDDRDLLFLLERLMKKNGYQTRTAGTGKQALEQIKAEPFDLVLCDFRLPDLDGLEVLRGIKEFRNSIQVILITGYSDVRMAVKTVRMGAFDYVTKPIVPDEILHLVEQALKTPASGPSTAATASTPAPSKEFVRGKSPAAERVHQHIDLIGPTDMTVIIQGESGTGKEVAARTIHKQSKRASKPFVAIDCGALTAELAASELFGHVRGAFTGAVGNKKGVFEQAKGGTIFLDEIGNLSYENQVKLLRVLQERVVRKLGDDRDVKINVRVIAATNENLQEAVVEGNFREDLFFRLNEFAIQLPALRHRVPDILPLATHFLADANHTLHKNVAGFSDAVVQKMESYPWPGNIREMRNVVKRAVLLTPGDKVPVEALPMEVTSGTSVLSAAAAPVAGQIRPLKEAVEEAERATILAVLEHVRHNKSRAAKLLQVDRKTLYNKLAAYNIEH